MWRLVNAERMGTRSTSSRASIPSFTAARSSMTRGSRVGVLWAIGSNTCVESSISTTYLNRSSEPTSFRYCSTGVRKQAVLNFCRSSFQKFISAAVHSLSAFQWLQKFCSNGPMPNMAFFRTPVVPDRYCSIERSRRLRCVL